MPHDQPIRAHNDHNVYILGAGFSKTAGLPLIKDFMNRMRDATAWLKTQADRGREIEAINRVLRFRLEATAAAYRIPLDVDNVEELFSLASAGGDGDLMQKMPLAIAATLDYARHVALPLTDDRPYEIGVKESPDWEPPKNWRPPVRARSPETRNEILDRWFTCPRYEFYLGLIAGYFNSGTPDRRDTIITFNYDTIVEEALRGLDIPFTYGPPELIGWRGAEPAQIDDCADKNIKVLKLHGSVNWVFGLDYALGSVDPSSIRPDAASDLQRRIATLQDYNEVRTQNHIPFLVAPTWQKLFHGYLATVWREAVEALKTATRVIILGYSMPPTDQHFKYLLAAGLQDNISLRKLFFVNPALANEEERPMLEQRLFSLFRREHFERGVIELEPLSVEQFLAGADQMPNGRAAIGRTLNPPGQDYSTIRWVGPSS